MLRKGQKLMPLIQGVLQMKINIHETSHIIVLDQGSRGSPPLASNAQVLIIDHHLSTQFPQDAVICSACNHLPVATTSLLTFIVVQPFLKNADSETMEECQWLAVLGVKGDLGDWKWDPPFPNALHDHVSKIYTKKSLSEAVSLLNARTPSLSFRLLIGSETNSGMSGRNSMVSYRISKTSSRYCIFKRITFSTCINSSKSRTTYSYTSEILSRWAIRITHHIFSRSNSSRHSNS